MEYNYGDQHQTLT